MTDVGRPDLTLVIVNHNTRKLLVECLESIYQKTHAITLECIVVDNASSDGSASAVEAHFPQVRVIANPVGRYFSAGNNQGIQVARGRYVLSLNPDMLVLGDTLTQLVRQLDANSDIGAATTIQYGPDMQILHNGSRQVTFSYLLFQYTFLGKLFPGKLRAYRDWLWYADWDRTTEREVGVMPGSFIIAPKAIWDIVNGFDERFPIYFTEDYLSQAIQKLNKRTVYLVTDGVIHYEGAATVDKSRRVLKARYLNMYLRGLVVYTGIVFGRLAQVALAIMLIPTWIVQRARAA